MKELPATDETISIFISYSRRNSDFVDHLEADLKSREFQTWVDRRKIEGGQRWKDKLKDAIDRCGVLLVVLSPEAVTSHYVQMEYGYALQQDKLVIPLLYQPCPEVPIDLNDIQWIDFIVKSYQDGLDDLLIALNRAKSRSSAKPKPVNHRSSYRKKSPSMVPPRPERPTEQDLDDLYREGVEAMVRGNLELTSALWQQILERDLKFRNGTLTPQMEDLREKLHPIRVERLLKEAHEAQGGRDWRTAAGSWRALLQLEPLNFRAKSSLEECLRSQGDEASNIGEWELAISSWEALLELRQTDAQATRQRDLALNNQKHMQYYRDAQQFIEKGNISAARTQLKLLRQQAPYYGDPEGLAIKAGITRSLLNPRTFE